MEDDDFNILAWWSRPERLRFRTLRTIATQILATPTSTVAVEQTLSRGGQILDERRSRLLPETLEAQVCISDWKRAERRTQRNNHSTEEDDIDDVESGASSNGGDRQRHVIYE